MNFKRKGEKIRYSFVDEFCIGRQCWGPGNFQHRSPLAGGGSMNTSSPPTPCCLNRAYRGCPDGPMGDRIEDCHLCKGTKSVEGERCYICAGTGQVHIVGLPAYQADLAKRRRAEGWKHV